MTTIKLNTDGSKLQRAAFRFLILAFCMIVLALNAKAAGANTCAVQPAYCLAALQKPAFPAGAMFQLLVNDDPACTDHIKNGTETDIDCGGGKCPACANFKSCAQASDCVSLVCSNGTCAAPACNDGVKNGSETGVDCGGGACPLCAVGVTCSMQSDCSSGVCSGGICAGPTCSDAVKNGIETDIDCGGGMCPLCAVGKACTVGTDCASGTCVGNICAPGP